MQQQLVWKLDIDGILRDFVSAFHRTYVKYYPEHVPLIKPVLGWGLDKVYPLGKKVVQFMYEEHCDECFLDADIYPGAHDFFNQLKEIGKVHLVTYQPVGCEITTLKWLEKHGLKYDAISFIFDKTTIDGACLIDDAVHNLTAEAKSGKSVPVALSRPWNADWDGHKYDTYGEIVKFAYGLYGPNIPS